MNFRVIRALLLREMKARYAQNYLGYTWIILEPAFHILILGLLFGFRGKNFGASIDGVIFLFTGVIPMIGYRYTVTNTVSAVRQNIQLLSYPRVRPLDAMIARFALNTAQFYFILFVGGGVLLMAGFDAPFSDPLLMVIGGFSLLIMGLSLGMALSIIVHFASDFEMFGSVIVRGVYFTSGVFFVVDQLPYEVQRFFLLNPCLHALDLIRQGMFGPAFRGIADVQYLAYWTVLGFAACLFATFSFRNRYYLYYDR